MEMTFASRQLYPAAFAKRDRPYLKQSTKAPPTTIWPVNSTHAPERAKRLAADCPISDVVTIREVITLLLHRSFQSGRRSLSSKGIPAI